MTLPTERDAVQTLPFPGVPEPDARGRWLQLTAGLIGMVAVSNFQYGWTLFTLPLEKAHGWNRVQLGDAFSLFILAQTWLVPVEGYLADRFGPRRLVVCGGVLAALAWALLANTDSYGMVCLAQILCGCGSGIVYGLSMGNALKWFPDRRGLAAGLTAAAFGTGSALTVLPIRWTIDGAGYGAAFLWFGLAQGLVIVASGLAMRFPATLEVASLPRAPINPTGHDFTPGQVIRSPVFWLLYGMMTMGAIPGLLMTGQMALMAKDFGVGEVPIHLIGFTVAALPLAIMIDRLLGGLTRPFFGWVSDKIGREWAMGVAFGLEGGALLLLILFASNPVMFVVMSGIAFFGWGAVFSLFPAAAADLFGRKFATTNNGLLYTAKGMASLLLFLLNRLQSWADSWVPVFLVMIAFDWLAALLALAVLRPMRRRLLAGGGHVAPLGTQNSFPAKS